MILKLRSSLSEGGGVGDKVSNFTPHYFALTGNQKMLDIITLMDSFMYMYQHKKLILSNIQEKKIDQYKYALSLAK